MSSLFLSIFITKSFEPSRFCVKSGHEDDKIKQKAKALCTTFSLLWYQFSGKLRDTYLASLNVVCFDQRQTARSELNRELTGTVEIFLYQDVAFYHRRLL